MNLFLFYRKLYQVNIWPWTHVGIIGIFTHNACLKYFLTTTWSREYIKTPWWTLKSRICIYSTMSIYCLTLNKWRSSCIFYPQCNVENIFWQYHNVRHKWKPQDRHQKHEYASIMSKWYQFIVWPRTNGGHLGLFTHNAMSKIFSDNATVSGILLNPIIDTKNMNLSLVLKNISIYCLTLDKWRPSWILPTMQCPKLFLTTPLDRAYLKTL